jgi:hypothetical protein
MALLVVSHTPLVWSDFPQAADNKKAPAQGWSERKHANVNITNSLPARVFVETKLRWPLKFMSTP